MTPKPALSAFRVLVRGEGVDSFGEPIGFFTTRQVRAGSATAAETDAVAAVLQGWRAEGGSVLQDVRSVSPFVAKRIHVGWYRRPRGGFTFFDSAEAESAALRIERRASGL